MSRCGRLRCVFAASMAVAVTVVAFANVASAASLHGGVLPESDALGRKTGFYHVERNADGRWWTVDPDGKPFVPIGIEHCRLEHNPGYKERMLAKHGSAEAWEEETLARLKEWGFTLFGGACSSRLFHRGIAHSLFTWVGEPYSFDGGDKAIVQGAHKPGSAFPNVFNPSWPQYCREWTRKHFAPHRNDRDLFGWFFDNELAWWGDGKHGNGLYGLCDTIAALSPEHSARKAYDEFAAAHGEWATDEIKRGFMSLLAEKYFGTIASAIREADPNHMVLGCRFAGLGSGVAPEVWEAAGRHLDIVSFNNYPWADLERNLVFSSAKPGAKTVLDEYAEVYRMTKRPLMVTEWSFPALDKGLPCTWGAGMRVNTENERVRASALFARTMLSMPFVVGYDYFMWRDQPAQGWSKTLSENCNYGLVNADGEPYEALTSMFARLHKDARKWRTSKAPPSHDVEASVMPQSAEEFVLRNKVSGGLASFKSEQGASRIAKFDGFGSLNVWLKWKVSGRVAYPAASRVVSSTEGRGPAGLPCRYVVAEGERDGAQFQVETRLTPLSDGSTLAELTGVTNRGTLPFELQSCFLAMIADFPAESVYPMRQAPNVWAAPRRLAWREKDGGTHIFGCETWSLAWSPRSAFWIGKDGAVHPDAIFDLGQATSVEPGETWRPDSVGLFYARIFCAKKDAVGDMPGDREGKLLTKFNFSDPTVWRASDGKWLAMPSGMKPLLVSDDLFTWKDAGFDILTEKTRSELVAKTVGDRDPTFGGGFWAPDVAKVGDRWILTVTLYGGSFHKCTIVSLVADAPEGPFKDPKVLVDAKAAHIADSIDPEIVCDGDRTYLFFGSQDGIFRLELTHDARAPLPGAKPVHVAGYRSGWNRETLEKGRYHHYEGVYLHRRGEWWYMFASGGGFRDHTYRVVVARAKTLDGPFLDRDGKPIREGFATTILSSGKSDRFYGPGHNGEIFTKDGRDWMFYHVHDRRMPLIGKYAPRPMVVQEIKWDADGWPYFKGGKPDLKN